ncbi:MAG: hypothetical protein NVSMB17_02100 [Candidatus Dormibacteria bacterium]
MNAEPALSAFEAGLPAYVPAPVGFRAAALPRREVLGLRRAERNDQARVEEICHEVFRGDDHVPGQFEAWLDAEDGNFSVAEVDGRVAAIHRVVAAGAGVAWYEGLRVAPEFRGRGLGRQMVRMAMESARRRGAVEMRLNAGPECGRFFEQLGFTPLVEVARWDAAPRPRGQVPAVLAPEHSAVALGWFRQDGAFRRYPGLNPVFGRTHEGDQRNVDRLARDGRLRFCGDVPAFAAVIPPGTSADPLRVTFLAGRGDSMQELLEGLRHHAHTDGHALVRVLAPADHPCSSELAASGFDIRDDFRLTVYTRGLVDGPVN